MGLKYDPSVQDFIRGLAPAPKKAIRQALAHIADDPYHPELAINILDTAGPERMLRARVANHYRIVYLVKPGHVYIRKVMHRSDGYRWL